MAYEISDARNEIASVLGITLPDSIDSNERIIEGRINGEDCIIVCFPIVVRYQPASFV